MLSISIADLFRMKGADKVFDRTALWQHAVGPAVGAKILARNAGLPLEEEVFIAGLLHDIRVLLLDLCLTTEFEEIIKLTTDHHLPLIRAEDKVLGFNHTLVGKYAGGKLESSPHLGGSLAPSPPAGSKQELLGGDGFGFPRR